MLCLYLVAGDSPIPWFIALPLCPFILAVGKGIEVTMEEARRLRDSETIR